LWWPSLMKTCKHNSFCVGVVWQTQIIQHLVPAKNRTEKVRKLIVAILNAYLLCMWINFCIYFLRIKFAVSLLNIATTRKITS